jgi:hypothetical protein
MALPKKKSRTITVNDEEYRYIISTGKYDEKNNFDLNITIQIAHGEANILKIEGLVTRDFWLDFPNEIKSKEEYPIITIKDISKIIVNSIKRGWNPNLKGKPFILKLNNDFNSKNTIN